jgi:hypothetical protein
MTKVLRQLEALAIAEGLKPGTPAYEFRMLQLRVQTCREMRRLSSCQSCVVYDECEYVKGYFRILNEEKYLRAQEKKKAAEERAAKEAYHYQQASMEDGSGDGEGPGEES